MLPCGQVELCLLGSVPVFDASIRAKKLARSLDVDSVTAPSTVLR